MFFLINISNLLTLTGLLELCDVLRYGIYHHTIEQEESKQFEIPIFLWSMKWIRSALSTTQLLRKAMF